MAKRADKMVDITENSSLYGAISIQHARKVFGENTDNEVVALEDLSLEIRQGEFISLIGSSGCGKSTLLRLIVGLDTPTSGDLYLDGEAITEPNHERGLVFQDPTLFPWLNVHGNVAAGLVARNVYKEKKKGVDEFIKLVGLSGFEKSYPHHLSGGMAQRVSLARALVNQPKVLLMDEPLGALDAFTRMQMQDEILRIWQERRTTVVLVTHDVDEAVYMSDRIVIMSARPGKIQEIINVPQTRPRARNNPDFLRLRTEILEILHFASKAEPLSYYI
jgi:ABC-type nitrate/sulfonate/bicarbonate transport system ATPase subunit